MTLNWSGAAQYRLKRISILLELRWHVSLRRQVCTASGGGSGIKVWDCRLDRRERNVELLSIIYGAFG